MILQCVAFGGGALPLNQLHRTCLVLHCILVMYLVVYCICISICICICIALYCIGDVPGGIHSSGQAARHPVLASNRIFIQGGAFLPPPGASEWSSYTLLYCVSRAHMLCSTVSMELIYSALLCQSSSYTQQLFSS